MPPDPFSATVILVKPEFLFGTAAGLNSFVKRSEFSQVGGLPVLFDLSDPASIASVGNYACSAAGVGAATRGVAAIFRLGDATKIVKAIVRAVAVDVVDLFRLFSVNHLPNNPVSVISGLPNTDHHVAITEIRATGGFASIARVESVVCVKARPPVKEAGRWVVIQHLTKKLLFGRAFGAHNHSFMFPTPTP
jgi:hypothetical protein